jgi:hypothetical protein
MSHGKVRSCNKRCFGLGPEYPREDTWPDYARSGRFLVEVGLGGSSHDAPEGLELSLVRQTPRRMVQRLPLGVQWMHWYCRPRTISWRRQWVSVTGLIEEKEKSSRVLTLVS